MNKEWLNTLEGQLSDAKQRLIKLEILGDEIQATKLRFMIVELENKINDIKEERNDLKKKPKQPKVKTVMNKYLFSFIGLGLLLVLILFIILIPNPTNAQYEMIRIIIALAGSSFAAGIPGFLKVKITDGLFVIIAAGGALAVFIILFFFNPASLLIK